MSIIAGGGFSGTVAAYTLLKDDRTGRKPVSCSTTTRSSAARPSATSSWSAASGSSDRRDRTKAASPDEKAGSRDMWLDIGLPTEFEFGKLAADRRPMVFPHTNYQYQLWSDDFENHGFFFDTPSPHWVRNPWGHDLEGTP